MDLYCHVGGSDGDAESIFMAVFVGCRGTAVGGKVDWEGCT